MFKFYITTELMIREYLRNYMNVTAWRYDMSTCHATLWKQAMTHSFSAQELSPSLSSFHDPWVFKCWPPSHHDPLQLLLFSSGLQCLSLQDKLDLFGIQCLIHEQSICQAFVLFSVRLQQGFGTFIRLLETAREKTVREGALERLVFIQLP